MEGQPRHPALETVEECPVCGGRAFRQFAISDGLEIQRCRDCTLIFASPRIPEEQTRRFFEREYLEADQRIAVDMTEYREKPMSRLAKRIKQHHPRGGRLLDVGTASGHFLGCFETEPDWRVEGLEPSRKAADHAAARYGVPIHCGFLDTVKLPNSAFDVITFLDGFFLDPYPDRSLSRIGDALKPDGTLWFEIPGLNFRLLKNTGIVARMLYGVPAQLNPAMQLFFYEEKTLSRLLAKHGFALIQRHPEQSPIYGGAVMRFLNHAYFGLAALLYRLTGGRVHLAAKEVLVYARNSE